MTKQYYEKVRIVVYDPMQTEDGFVNINGEKVFCERNHIIKHYPGSDQYYSVSKYHIELWEEIKEQDNVTPERS